MKKLCSLVCAALLAGSFFGPLSAPVQANPIVLTSAECEALFYELMLNQLSSVAEGKRLLTEKERAWAKQYDLFKQKGLPCPMASDDMQSGPLQKVKANPQRALRGRQLYDEAMAQINYANTPKPQPHRKLSECELAFYELHASLSGPAAMRRSPSSGEIRWASAFPDFDQAPSATSACPPLNDHVRYYALSNARRDPQRVIAGVQVLEGWQKAERAKAAAAANRLRNISTCDRAYFHFFNRLNNPAFAHSRRLTDEEIGWGLDYESSQRKGEACPPMPKQVIEGILAEANSNPDSTLAGQRALAQIEQREKNAAQAQRAAQTPQYNPPPPPPPPARSEPTFAEQTAEWLRQKNKEQEYNRGKQYRCYVNQGRQICGYY